MGLVLPSRTVETMLLGADWYQRISAAVVCRLAGVAAVFSMTALIAREVGPSVLGTFAVVLAIVKIASVLSRLGMEQPLLRFCALVRNADSRERDAGVLWLALLLGTAVSAVMAGGAFHLTDSTGSWLPFGGLGSMRVMVFAVIPTTICVLGSAALRGYGYASLSLLTQFTLTPALMALGLICEAASISRNLGLAYVFCSMLSACVVLGLLLGTSPRFLYSTGVFISGAHELFRASRALLLSDFGVHGMQLSPILVVGWVSLPDQAGQYHAANQIVGLLGLPLVAVGSVIVPKFAVASANEEKKKLDEAFRRATITSIGLSAPLLIVFAFFPAVVAQFFGGDFFDARSVVLILLIGAAVNIAAGPVGALLAVAGEEQAVGTSRVVAAVATLVLCVVTVPKYGADGAAFSMTLGQIVFNVMAAYQAKERLGVTVWPWLNLRR